jgi:hypothetical protein
LSENKHGRVRASNARTSALVRLRTPRTASRPGGNASASSYRSVWIFWWPIVAGSSTESAAEEVIAAIRDYALPEMNLQVEGAPNA